MHNCPLQTESTALIRAGEGGAFTQSVEGKKHPKITASALISFQFDF